MAKTVVEVRKWSNSRALVIPSQINAQLKWRVGDIVHVSVENGCLVFRPLQIPLGGRGKRNDESVTNGDSAK